MRWRALVALAVLAALVAVPIADATDSIARSQTNITVGHSVLGRPIDVGFRCHACLVRRFS